MLFVQDCSLNGKVLEFIKKGFYDCVFKCVNHIAVIVNTSIKQRGRFWSDGF